MSGISVKEGLLLLKLMWVSGRNTYIKKYQRTSPYFAGEMWRRSLCVLPCLGIDKGRLSSLLCVQKIFGCDSDEEGRTLWPTELLYAIERDILGFIWPKKNCMVLNQVIRKLKAFLGNNDRPNDRPNPWTSRPTEREKWRRGWFT